MQPPQNTRPKTARSAHIGLRPEDFRRLGLGPSEARVTVIRRAAWKLATPLVDPSVTQRDPQKETELALLLASAYRLLDPRRRDHFAERVQLLRSEPIPLRSHLWDAGEVDDLDVAYLSDARELRSPSSPAETMLDSDSDQELGIEQHDWMLDLIADLRTESSPQQPVAVPPILTKALDVDSSGYRDDLLELARLIHPKPWFNHKQIVLASGLLATIIVLTTLGLFLRSGRPDAVVTPEVAPQQAVIKEPAPATLASGSVTDRSLVENSSVGATETVEVLEPADNPVGKLADSIAAAPELEIIEAPELKDLLKVDTPPNASLNLTLDASPKPAEPSTPEPSPVPTPVVPTPVPTPASMPSSRTLDVAKQQFRNLELTDVELSALSPVQLWHRGQATTPGSSERLAIGLAAIVRAMLSDDEAMPIAMMHLLPNDFAAAAVDFGLMALADVEPRAVTMIEQERAIRFAMRVSDEALADERFALASEAARIGTALAAAHGDVGLKKRLKQRRDSITTAERMATSYHQDTASVAIQVADRSAALVAARHFCVNLRRWPEGLPWMAAGSDPRLSSLATEELALPKEATAMSIASLAKRWLEQADRRKGRETESIQLHARQLLTSAIDRSEGFEKLELERELSVLDLELPGDLQPLDLESASKQLIPVPGYPSSGF